ncbi:MAG TPA: hypothetical protein VKK61_08330, partial [Tepidisphaeraceae bacterium]|nr:hypothetical protein [Tepidisphaeraceae bacterium]
MQRHFGLIALLVMCAPAFGQHAPANAPSQRGAAPQPPQQTPADAMQRSGGSLLRATTVSIPDPNQAKLSSVSYFAVPEPIPKTLKKH